MPKETEGAPGPPENTPDGQAEAPAIPRTNPAGASAAPDADDAEGKRLAKRRNRSKR